MQIKSGSGTETGFGIYNDYAVRIDTFHYLNHRILRHCYAACSIFVISRAMEEYRRTSARRTFFIEAYVKAVLICL